MFRDEVQYRPGHGRVGERKTIVSLRIKLDETIRRGGGDKKERSRTLPVLAVIHECSADIGGAFGVLAANDGQWRRAAPAQGADPVFDTLFAADLVPAHQEFSVRRVAQPKGEL